MFLPNSSASVEDTTGVDMSTAGPVLGTADDKEPWQVVAGNAIMIYAVPVVTIVGLVGNILMLIIMQKPSQRRSPIAVYMSALAVADSLVLILDFLNNWFKLQLEITFLSHSVGFCRFYRFFFNVCYTYAAWLVTALAVERFIVIWFPLKAKLICTYKKALCVVVVLGALCFLFYINNLWGWELNDNGQCDVTTEMAYFLNMISPWLSAAAYSYVPIAILIFCSTGIILQLCRASSQRRSMTCEGEAASARSVKIDEEVFRVTISVITVVVAFLVLSVPLTSFYIIVFATNEFINPAPITALVEGIVLLFGLSNHSVNFFLYIMTSASFRGHLKALFGIKPKARTTSAGTGTTTANSIPGEKSSTSNDTRF
jgi:hypothetical protein